jgi:hypothetical protein
MSAITDGGTAAASGAVEAERRAPRLRAARAARAIAGRLRWDDLRTGRWFAHAVVGYVAHHEAERLRELEGAAAERGDPARAGAILRRACVEACLAGAAAAGSATAATVTSAETDGIGGIVSIPLAALTVLGEMLLRTAIHVRMTCELGDLYGLRFDPDDPTDLTHLYALAFRTVSHEGREEDPGRGLVERVLATDVKHAGRALGGELLGESVLRNVVPFVGIAASAARNWQLTSQVGRTVQRYLAFRCALGDVVSSLEAKHADLVPLFVEGVWHVLVADGRLAPDEAALLAYLVRRGAADAREELTACFVSDEAGWIERLGEVHDAGAKRLLLGGLTIAAAMAGRTDRATRAVLSHVGRALGEPDDPARLDALARRLEELGPMAARGVLGERAPAAGLRAA